MRITGDEILGGFPIITVRNWLRKVDSSGFTEDQLAVAMAGSRAEASQLIAALAEGGFLEREGDGWATTVKGGGLLMAKVRRYKREKAEAELARILERVNQINSADEYPMQVTKLVLFGSMVGNSPDVGDIDLAVEISHKADDMTIRHERLQARIRQIRAEKGLDYIRALFRVEEEVKQIVKGRSGMVSIHRMEELAGLEAQGPVPTRVILDLKR